MKVKIELETVSNAMATGADVKQAIEITSIRIKDCVDYIDEHGRGDDSGVILDRKGDIVGKWEVTV